ncbi:MAG: Ig-like domain-containing protein, partial [Candidatus Neomarinimicrobiota bacterium]|nr:Ig-like domain-containing protein [Candidatus Neomarinimicrobiota bacterium]
MFRNFFILSASLILAYGQTDSTSKDSDTLRYVFEPDSLTLNVGETGMVTIKLVDAQGNLSNNPFLIYGQPRRSLKKYPRISDSTGFAIVTVQPFKSGDLKLRARSIAVKRTDRVYGSFKVKVPEPKLKKIVFNNLNPELYSNVSFELMVDVYDDANLLRTDHKVTFSSSNTKVAEVNKIGILSTYKAGKAIIIATAGDISKEFNLKVVKNPIKNVVLSVKNKKIRTGDVEKIDGKAYDRRDRLVDDARIEYSYTGKADYGIGLPASAQITSDGRFVAETAGMYTVSVSSNGYTKSQSIEVVPRNVSKDIELIGFGLVSNVKTSDLWIWPGIGQHEGKDFAVTGTWGANGEAYFWDVTDPAKMVIIDTITVDARTVNDVKISEDGRVGVITREGASSRKNGFVILDVSDPYNVTISAAYNDDMTGGVHNVFIYENHVYAVNNGRKYDIINIDDPKKPFRVGVYELDTPGHSIHDVWIEDGIAYSSNWADGVQAVDVGGLKFDEKNRSAKQFNPLLAKAGQGSPSNPVHLADLKDPNGHNHAAFPFKSQSTDKFYIVGGDEWFPWRYPGKPRPYQPRGGFHFLDFTDIENPKEEAVYTITEAGSHNHWIQGDTLIAAYYNGGLR